jgi:hypothetical protein
MTAAPTTSLRRMWGSWWRPRITPSRPMRVREGVAWLAIERELLHSGLKDGRDKELLVRFLLQNHNFCFPAMTMYSFYVFYALKVLQARMPRYPP